MSLDINGTSLQGMLNLGLNHAPFNTNIAATKGYHKTLWLAILLNSIFRNLFAVTPFTDMSFYILRCNLFFSVFYDYIRSFSQTITMLVFKKWCLTSIASQRSSVLAGTEPCGGQPPLVLGARLPLDSVRPSRQCRILIFLRTVVLLIFDILSQYYPL